VAEKKENTLAYSKVDSGGSLLDSALDINVAENGYTFKFSANI
jgi:hypothetical protein